MPRNTSLLLVPAAVATSLAWAAPPADSPYFTDAQNSQVQDATSQTIGQVNMITCVMSAMRPDALVNQGPYNALIDQNVCDASKQSSTASAGGGASGATQAPKYMTAVVNSTRASNTDPMLVSAWISIEQQDTPVTVFAHISATAPPSSDNPYGQFRLDYCGKPAGASGACMMNGYMQAANGTLTYYETDQGGGGNGGNQVTALQLASVGTTSGSGSVDVTQSFNGQTQTQAFNFAYDQSFYYRQDGSSSFQCFSRDASDPATAYSVGQYGLYDATTGAEVTLNSGFPIQYTVSGNDYQGYVGYYGLSSQPGAPAPVSGSTVQKVDYQSGGATSASYTLESNNGTLARFTRQTTTLKEIDQLPLQVFVGDVTGSGLPDPNTQYVVVWDEASQQFLATGEMQCGQNGCQSGALSGGQSSIAVTPSFWASSGLQGWSQSLGGGSVFVALNNAGSPLDTTSVIYYNQDLVYPDDSNLPAALYCVSNCPTATSLQSYFTQSSGSPVTSPYASATFQQYQPTTTPVSYQLNGNVLVGGDGNAVIYADATAYQQFQQYQNGVMSGHLVANLTDAQCGTDPNTSQPQYCDWKIGSAPVYYQWQTGPNSWNHFAALKDGNNNFVRFDAPINVNFVVPANVSGNMPYGNYAGTNMVLQYGGFGNLWGIPGTCVSSVTNQPVPCNDQSGTAIYISAFQIPYDPSASPQQGVVTRTSGGVTTQYLVKWLNRQILFARKPTTACTNDGLVTSNATLPDQSGLQDPSSSSSAVYNGVEPTVTSAPRVIQGQVMY
jgi:hypothetical protein